MYNLLTGKKLIILFCILFNFLISSQQSYCENGLSFIINQIDAAQFPEITVFLTVSDEIGVNIQGLRLENFNLIEDGINITSIQVSNVSVQPESTAIALLLDTSGSMKGETINNAKKAAGEFVNQMNVLDKIIIAEFNEGTFFKGYFSNNKQYLQEKISSLHADRKDTYLYDAINDGAAQFKSNKIHHKTMIVFSDGIDEGSSLKEDDAINKANQYNVPVYMIGLGVQTNHQAIRRISKLTGGIYFNAPSYNDLSRIYSIVSKQISNQYKLIYTSLNKNMDGSLRNVQIKVKYKNFPEEVDSKIYRSRHEEIQKTASNLPLKNTKSNSLLFPAILFFVVLVVVLIFYFTRKKPHSNAIRVCPHCGAELLFSENICPKCSNMTLNKEMQKEFDTNFKNTKLPGIEKTMILKPSQAHFAWLVVLEGILKGQNYQLNAEETYIGRLPENQVVLNDDFVSNKHVKIILEGDNFIIHDLASSNGTFVNGVKIYKQELKEGDEITIGGTKLLFKETREAKT